MGHGAHHRRQGLGIDRGRIRSLHDAADSAHLGSLYVVVLPWVGPAASAARSKHRRRPLACRTQRDKAKSAAPVNPSRTDIGVAPGQRAVVAATFVSNSSERKKMASRPGGTGARAAVSARTFGLR
jgi:hypothetical protein